MLQDSSHNCRDRTRRARSVEAVSDVVEKLQRATVRYEPSDVPVKDERQRVRGAQVRIETAGKIVETTVIPMEGDGPHGWIAEAKQVEELYEQGLIAIKLALAEAANEGARGRRGTIELGVDDAELTPRTGPATSREREARPIPVEQLAGWRAEAEGLDELAARGTDHRARVAVMDVDVVLSLLDEVDRLRRALRMHADDGLSVAGAIATATLSRWREEAVRVSESDPDERRLADRLLAAMNEIEGRRRGARAELGVLDRPVAAEELGRVNRQPG